MRIVIKLTALLLMTYPAFAEPFAQTDMDWNGDGHVDRIVLQPSPNDPSRADLLIYLGTPGTEKIDLFKTLAGFTHAADGIDTFLLIQPASQPNAITIIEQGGLFGRSSRTQTRVIGYRQNDAHVLQYNMQQIHPTVLYYLTCQIDFEAGEGALTRYGQLYPFDVDPAQVQAENWGPNIIPDKCQFITPTLGMMPKGDADLMIDQLELDMNVDGLMDLVWLTNEYDGVFIYVFLGQTDGSHVLMGVGRNLAWAKWQGDYRDVKWMGNADHAKLYVTPGNPHGLQVKTYEDDNENGAKTNVVAYINWDGTRPVLTRFDVMIHINDEPEPAMHCVNDFADRVSYLAAKIDGIMSTDQEIRAPYRLTEWDPSDVDKWIYDCRP
ncbi:hypothetical protein [Parasulfitobacter algicola]|uniref:Uncharacterized protein n=1 Tax=Parasulfitobacter algicola TaxID=2614809 RepID=A0ABX2IRU6_9RHOB|nr:hypothetical protein [Sulfitobacter algicola]NSX55622.1 hypothetical protein [Sulfitobacter algicola]